MRRRVVAFRPLLQAYLNEGVPTGRQLSQLPVVGSRFQAILTADERLLSETFLDKATKDEFRSALVDFYNQTVTPSLQRTSCERHFGVLRHAVDHLCRSNDSVGVKAARVLDASGPYHVPGLGLSFWSALLQAIDPTICPGHNRAIARGMERVGLLKTQEARPAKDLYQSQLQAYSKLLCQHDHISALHLDHFFLLVSGMQGRELWFGLDSLAETLVGCDIPALIRAERTQLPLRERIRLRGSELAHAANDLEEALETDDVRILEAAISRVAYDCVRQSHLEWNAYREQLFHWTRRLWNTETPFADLAAFVATSPIPGTGLWWPTSILTIRDPHHYFLWDERSREAYRRISPEAVNNDLAEGYQLYCEGVSTLCELYNLHPLEVPALIGRILEQPRHSPNNPDTEDVGFGGFCSDTFTFLSELNQCNTKDWMGANRERYQYAVREPLIELCRALVQKYVEPILNRAWKWNIETTPRPGKALTSICKNDYGQSTPYVPEMWITFCRAGETKKAQAQLFVRVTEDTISFGFRLGKQQRQASKLFRRNLQDHGQALYESLIRSGAVAQCQFVRESRTDETIPIKDAGDLRAWATGKSLVVGKSLAKTDPLLASENLVGEIILTFDRVLPAFACAFLDDPSEVLTSRTENCSVTKSFTADDFTRKTYLPAEWLAKSRSLLELKRQLILQGVPGTGKTFVANSLARWLTGDREDSVRLVQFHPAFSYEEFVEGIKAQSIETNGRHEVTYPVEAGLLCDFAAKAAQSPSLPFVLIIDEINRGNLPRIFGELLYLLEYRNQSVILPYSRRNFRLPRNLYILGTMNAADRSVALIDQALRRRFSFLEMPPDGQVLTKWLEQHPPQEGPQFANIVVKLFERLNTSLTNDLGPHYRIGHSYFMVPNLQSDTLATVWEHQVRPLIAEYFASQPNRVDTYDLDRMLQAERKKGNGKRASSKARN